MIGESVVSLSWDELDQPAGNFDGPFWITAAFHAGGWDRACRLAAVGGCGGL